MNYIIQAISYLTEINDVPNCRRFHKLYSRLSLAAELFCDILNFRKFVNLQQCAICSVRVQFGIVKCKRTYIYE